MVPALIVGGLTAWYLGLRMGIVIALVVAVALLLAQFVPGMSITVYALVQSGPLMVTVRGGKIAVSDPRSASPSTKIGAPFARPCVNQ